MYVKSNKNIWIYWKLSCDFGNSFSFNEMVYLISKSILDRKKLSLLKWIYSIHISIKVTTTKRRWLFVKAIVPTGDGGGSGDGLF